MCLQMAWPLNSMLLVMAGIKIQDFCAPMGKNKAIPMDVGQMSNKSWSETRTESRVGFLRDNLICNMIFGLLRKTCPSETTYVSTNSTVRDQFL